jgi:hypothetical protein
VISFEWKDLAWIVGVATLLGGLLLAFLRFKLAGDFAKAADVAVLTGRIAAMEQSLKQMPSHEDLRALQQRVGGLETQVAVVGEKLTGLGQIMVRVEHQVNLVSQHLIQEGR